VLVFAGHFCAGMRLAAPARRLTTSPTSTPWLQTCRRHSRIRCCRRPRATIALTASRPLSAEPLRGVQRAGLEQWRHRRWQEPDLTSRSLGPKLMSPAQWF